MAKYRVFDEESARQLSTLTRSSDRIEQVDDGEYFAANPGDAILAPSVKEGEVLYIRIKSPVAAPRPEPSRPIIPQAPLPDPAQVAAPVQKSEKHYVATGFLGLDGELEEEETPQPPKPWWKRMFVD